MDHEVFELWFILNIQTSQPDSTNFSKEKVINWNWKIFFFQIPISALIWLKGQTFLCIFSHSIYSPRWINDDPMVLTRGIFGLSLKVLLNHRGSSMNLRFQLIHRVLTRKFLSIIKKTKVKLHYLQKKITNQRKRNR